MANVNVTIIGLKRIGASFGLALKRYSKTPRAEHQFLVTGSDESADVLRTAHKLEAIDLEVRTPDAAVAKADLIILAARGGLYDDLYGVISAALKPGVVIMDLAPLKQPAIIRAEKYLPRDPEGNAVAYMVGTTPILNPALLHETADDTEHARADLFDNGTLILSPAVTCRGEAIQLVADLGALLGMSVHFTDPAEHDGMVASMETLPLLLNFGLFRTLQQNNAWDDLRRLSNPAFALNTLGLSQYGQEDTAALFDGNRDRTAQALEALIMTLDEIRDLVLDADPLLLPEALADVIQKRAEWLDQRQRGTWNEKTAITTTENLTLGGVLGTRFSFRGLRPGSGQNDKSHDAGKDSGKK